MKDLEQMVRDYISAYNNFDIDTMLADLADDVVFESREKGNITMLLKGSGSFRKQAELSKSYFSTRAQTVESMSISENKVVAAISYKGILATDLQAGLKKGEQLALSGESVFEFSDGRIVKLTERS